LTAIERNVTGFSHGQGCTNPGYQVVVPTKFCSVVPIICRSLVWNWLYSTLLAPKNS